MRLLEFVKIVFMAQQIAEPRNTGSEIYVTAMDEGSLSRGIPLDQRGIDLEVIKLEFATVGHVGATSYLCGIKHQLTLVKMSKVPGKSILK